MKSKLLIVVSFLLVGLFSCEDINEKEERYCEELTAKFDSKISNHLKDFIFEFETNSTQAYQQIKMDGKFCSVNIGSDKSGNKRVEIDHYLNKELIKDGYKICYDIHQLNYLIITNDIWKKVGIYTDDKGKRIDDASVIYNQIYLCDLQHEKNYFITSHRGEDPKQTISRGKNTYDMTFGKSWYPEDYVQFLIDSGYLKQIAESDNHQPNYINGYTEFLEKNNFLDIDK